MTASANTREFDLFGPWVDEVASPEDIPRLYRGHPINLATTRLVLKVPRNIPRREAHAGMDLYDHMLIAHEYDLEILSRRAQHSGFDATQIAYADIAAIKDAVNLLDGSLTITTRRGSHVAIPYNGSGGKQITALVNVLRDQFPRSANDSERHTRMVDAHLPGRDGALMVDFKTAARANPNLTPWAWHERQAVTPSAGGIAGAASRLLHRFSPMTLHGAVIAGDDAAMEIFSRRDFLIRGRVPELSSGRLVVPFAAVDQLATAPHPAYAGVTELTLTAGAAAVNIHVPEGSSAERAIASAFSTSAR
ncbi:hypothetical protein [Demequina sp.]|uniref:hypothetical protein n=1 Tax=Demequina sp. TaxID=2050685 RepID=UPI003D0B630B